MRFLKFPSLQFNFSLNPLHLENVTYHNKQELILISWTKFAQNLYLQHKPDEHYHRLSHIPTTLSVKIHLKLTILIFWIKFSQKGYFCFKTGQRYITMKLSMFRFVSELSFILNSILTLVPKMPEKSILSPEQHIAINFSILQIV